MKKLFKELKRKVQNEINKLQEKRQLKKELKNLWIEWRQRGQCINNAMMRFAYGEIEQDRLVATIDRHNIEMKIVQDKILKRRQRLAELEKN